MSLGVFVLLCFGFVAAISQINFQENIRDILPQDEEINEVTEIVEGLGLSNRIVVLVSDTSEVNPDKLVSIAHSMVDSLQDEFPNLIADVTLKISNQKLNKLFSFYSTNLPFYLKQDDYAVIANRIELDSVSIAMARMMRMLASPMGMVGNKFMIDDPLNVVTIPLQRAQELRLDQDINLYKNHLVSTDQKHLLFFIDVANPGSETELNGYLVDGLDGIIATMAAQDNGASVVYFGSPAMAVANARQIKKDIQTTVSIAMVFLLLFISFYYRKIQTFFLVLLPGLFGALAALSVLALFRDSVSVISLGIGSVLLGITIDYALHMMTHIKHEGDVRKVFKDLTFPTIICSLTSATAFLSLLFIQSTALQDLGIFAGVSIFSASLFTMVVFPHILIGKGSKAEEPKTENVVERLVNRLAAYPYHKNKWVLGLVLAITIMASFTWSNYGFEDDMLKLNYAPAHLTQAEQQIQSVSQIANNNLYLAATAKDVNAALIQNQALTDSLNLWVENGEIEGFLNLNRIVPNPNIQSERLAQWESFWTTGSDKKLIDALRAEGDKLGFEPDAFSSFESVVTGDYTEISAKDINEVISVFGSDFIVEKENGDIALLSLVSVKEEKRQDIAERLNHILGAKRIDRQSLANKLVQVLEQDFNKLVLYSLMAVFLILLLSYGRIEQALLVYIPILISWLWVLGLMGLFGLKFNIVNVIVCTFIFGIGVDYSIFVAHGLFQSGGKVASNFTTYKRAIILSAITTLVGIGALIFAKHPAIQSIALLTIIGISATIVITFTIEPLLYNIFVGKRKQKGLIPYTLFSVFVSAFSFAYFLLGCFLLTVLRWILFLPLAPRRQKKRFFHFVVSKFCWSNMYIMMNLKKTILDKEKADFSDPCVIIANHHSFQDILMTLLLHPKLIMVTNSWVYNSPFFGKTVQYADFIHAGDGVEGQIEQIEAKVKKGYSIIVFPEGSRAASQKLRRFHKGAFYLAEQLQLDIQPLLIHGTSYTMPKGDDFCLKNGHITMKFLDRIKADDLSFGKTYTERTKSISKYFKAEHKALLEMRETPSYFREIMLKNYLYRGPILEWYFKIKTRLEGNYEIFHELVPRKADVVDLGCGYGFMTYALAFSSDERNITGFDYDGDKIDVANDCAAKPANISFAQGDVVTVEYGETDVFILSDVLHYLNADEQLQVMNNMKSKLRMGGKIIVRDSDSSNKRRHEGSKLTEFFSTNIGFNKTRNQLNFVSRDFFEKFAEQNLLKLEVIDNTKLTSNLIFVLSHK